MKTESIILRNKIILNVMENDLTLSNKEKDQLLKLDDFEKLNNIWNNKILKNVSRDKISFDEIDFNLHNLISSVPEYIFSKSNRKDYIESVGDNVISDNIRSIILYGSNYRLITEDQIRSKMVLANFEITKMVDNIPEKYLDDKNLKYFFILLGMEIILNRKSSKEYMLSLWLLGLTSKGLDNIVGKSYLNLYEYCCNHYKVAKKIIKKANERGKFSIKDFIRCLSLDYQALTIKGSMKSMAGKLFERLILGTALSMLGFDFKEQFIPTSDYEKYRNNEKPIFWLSSKEDNDGREKDATILYRDKIINIDIGLIGKGNPEIINDKITRYRNMIKRNHIDIAKEHTIVIAGEKNDGNTITQAAEEAHTTVIEIHENSSWMSDLNEDIVDFFGRYESPFDYDRLKNEEDVTNNIDFKQFVK